MATTTQNLLSAKSVKTSDVLFVVIAKKLIFQHQPLFKRWPENFHFTQQNFSFSIIGMLKQNSSFESQESTQNLIKTLLPILAIWKNMLIKHFESNLMVIMIVIHPISLYDIPKMLVISNRLPLLSFHSPPWSCSFQKGSCSWFSFPLILASEPIFIASLPEVRSVSLIHLLFI